MTDTPARDTENPDPRLTPARGDIAAASLRNRVIAETYVEPVPMQVRAASLPMRRAPDAALAYETELVHGEDFDLYENRDGWAWGQAKRDGYVGYVAIAGLRPPPPPATHRVRALASFLYPGAGIKATPLMTLPYGAVVAVLETEGRFARTPDGYLFFEHLAPLAERAPDPVAEAERFLGVPYLWGGKTSHGLDCSALVQTACHAAGLAAPRDSDMQERALGEPLAITNDPAHYRRGDVLFWPGHVALCRGDGTMVHATAFSMSVMIEEIGPALARIEGQGHPLRSARRLPRP